MNIESSFEDVDEVTKRVVVSIPADMVGGELDSALQRVAATSRVKGFRPGKAPISLVKKLHGSRVRMEVANRLISDSLRNLVQEHSIEMVGTPDIDISSFDEGGSIQYTADISIYPTPEIADFKSFAISVPERSVSDEDVDAVVNRMRESKATSKPVEGRDTAQENDVIDGELLVAVEGEETPERPEPLIVGLGEGKLPEDLEQSIVGMKCGETKELSSTFPEDHPNEELRGKSVVYTVTLKSLMEKVLPEVDDAFAKEMGLEAETALELRLKIREKLEEETEKEKKSDIHAAILDQLIERNDFKVPQTIVDDEIRSLLVRNGFIDASKVDPMRIDVAPFREGIGEMALKRVRTSIAVDRLAEQEGISVTDEEIDAHMNEVAEENQISLDEVKKFFGSDNRVLGLKLELTRNKVLDMLVDRATVSYASGDDLESKEKSSAKKKSSKKKASKKKDD